MNVIDRARERIERDGWWQMNSDSNRGRYCVLTSFLGGPAWNVPTEAVRLIAAEIGADGTDDKGDREWSIADWNDNPNTTLEDVLLVMKRASARLDEAGS